MKDAASQNARQTDAGADALVPRYPALTPCDSAGSGPARIRIATWNIKAAMQHGLEAVSEVLTQLDADVVLLQEVDLDVERSGRVDQPGKLAQGIGYDEFFGPTLELEGGLYGIAMLSRLPFASARIIRLTNEGAAEPRTALDASICIGSRTLRVINLHADYRVAGATQNIHDVLAAINDARQDPIVFAGDLNLESDQPGIAACTSAGLIDVAAKFGSQPTLGARRIDYVFVTQPVASWIVDAMVEKSDASDHVPLVVELAPAP